MMIVVDYTFSEIINLRPNELNEVSNTCYGVHVCCSLLYRFILWLFHFHCLFGRFKTYIQCGSESASKLVYNDDG